MPEATRQIARAIKGLMAERGVTQQQIAHAIDRTQGYVSERANGLDAWNTAELPRAVGLVELDGSGPAQRLPNAYLGHGGGGGDGAPGLSFVASLLHELVPADCRLLDGGDRFGNLGESVHIDRIHSFYTVLT